MTKPKPKRIQLAKKKSGLLNKFNKGNFVKLIFPKFATMMINLLSIGPRVILRSAFQILRTNIWTRLISTVLLISFDLYSFARKRISKKQLVINLILSATLLIGGSAGWFFGTHSISAIVAENTAIWIIAGLAGAGVFSAIFDKICRKMLGKFLKSDVDDMLDIINEEFECMIIEHELDDDRANAIADKIKISDQICLRCFCSQDKKKRVRELLIPYFEESK